MASPYLVIGAFPRLGQWLPKPGAWMETFKQLMGFVLLGTVVYLFSTINADCFIPTLAADDRRVARLLDDRPRADL